MKNKSILLPAKVYENSFHSFLEKITSAVKYQDVTFDFVNVVFYIPAAWVSLLALIKKLSSEGVEITFDNLDDESDLFRYLQRIDFLKNCGIDYPEDFKRREQGDRFVPIKTITRKNLYGSKSTTNTSQMSSEVATCLAPEEASYIDNADTAEDFENYDETKTSLFDFIEYSVSELSNNVIAHSKSNGFISAQYTPKTNYVRVGIADFGIGIKESFYNTPYWKDEMSDIDAIELALQAEISSKNDGTSSTAPNLGLGLTFLQLLCTKLNGTFSIISYSGSFSLTTKTTLNFDYPGTVCLFRFKRTQAVNYPALFESIKQELELPTVLTI